MSTSNLFSEVNEPIDPGKSTHPVAEVPLQLTSESKLSAAMAPYQAYMRGEGLSENTIKAFMGDVRLLDRYFKQRELNPALGEIGTKELNHFLHWLRYERTNKNGDIIPCSPKSYARRVTTLKSFFGWLYAEEVLNVDPAAPVIQESVRAPLPRILFDDEIDRLTRISRDLLWSPSKPDARPYLIVVMLMQTALKKSEVVNLALEDVDTSNPREPVLLVRYADPKYAHKERKLFLGPVFLPVYNQYLRAYQPSERVFECTARNLEYVLSDTAALADIKNGLSFETMRWTSAVRSYRFGTPPEALRKKLGLSPITWRETFEKIKTLASPGL
ncbi:MAG: site-specific integrase [Chloroflexi bacterium]|nr:site-specific integrase [Chloroflexota bacterium]